MAIEHFDEDQIEQRLVQVPDSYPYASHTYHSWREQLAWAQDGLEEWVGHNRAVLGIMAGCALIAAGAIAHKLFGSHEPHQ